MLNRTGTRVNRWYRGSQRALGRFSRGLRVGLQRTFMSAWSWTASRHWMYLLQGFPALAALIAVIVLAGLRMALPAQELEARYLEQAKSAFKAHDYPRTLVCYERLAAMGQDRPDNLYEMAAAINATGDPDRALKMMNHLAPIDQNGHAPAHLWMASHYLKDMGDPRSRKLAEQHLQRALAQQLADPVFAHALLGELYARTDRPDLAEVHLSRAVESRPQLRLMYAQILAKQNKKSRATDEAKLAVNFFQDRAKSDLNDRTSRIGWAESLTFLEQFPQAYAVLQDGHFLKTDPLYRKSAAWVCYFWHLHVVRTKPDDLGEQWRLLESGLALDPMHPKLLDRLLSYLNANGEKAEKARTLIRTVLAKGEATATTHFLLGMDMWQQGNSNQALVHWEQAYRMDPNLLAVANNLAWLLAHAENPDLPRALKLVDMALANHPDKTDFRDTRGKIYMKLKRWQDALTDLQFVLARTPDAPGLHASLADLYEQLGDTEVAAEHRRIAERQAKKSKS
jgi:tetratricopeptide (TPR) repeat protein